jgi:hypothetical protein
MKRISGEASEDEVLVQYADLTAGCMHSIVSSTSAYP